MKRKTEFKSFKFQVKEMDDSKGTFEGYAAVFGNEDEVSDVIEKGAFMRSINARNGLFPIMFSHLYQEPSIGKAILSEDNYGLFAKGTLFIDRMQKAKDIYFNMKEGVSNSMSFMYDVLKYENEQRNDTTIRKLKEVKVYEASILNTGFAANQLAVITAVKSNEMEDVFSRINEVEKSLTELKKTNFDVKNIKEIISQLKSLHFFVDEKSKKNELEQTTDYLKSIIETIKKDLMIETH